MDVSCYLRRATTDIAKLLWSGCVQDQSHTAYGCLAVVTAKLLWSGCVQDQSHTAYGCLAVVMHQATRVERVRPVQNEEQNTSLGLAQWQIGCSSGTEKARLVEDKCEVVGQGLFALLIICLLTLCVCNGAVAGHSNSVDAYGVACWCGVLPTSVLAISIITELNMKLFCASCNIYSIYPVCAMH